MKNSVRKNALLTSLLAILISVSMLIGTTFAWFTDSVANTNNIIKSGKLDVVLEYWDGNSWVDVSGKSDILSNILWEPGAADVAYFKVANAGTLALKYQLGVNVVSEIEGVNQTGKTFKLSDFIMFGLVDGVNGETDAFTTSKDAIASIREKQALSAGYTEFSSLLPNNEEYVALVVYMPTTVNNIANHNGVNIPEINLGIECLATQYTHEYDSFGNQYDADAKYPLYGNIIDAGEEGDVNWELNNTGILEITPETNVGNWKEAVEYDANGQPVVATSPLGNKEACENVTTLKIEDGVKSIGSFSAKFPNLTGEVVIPSSVTYIGQEAFQNAPITKLTFAPGGTEKLCIAPGAFKSLAVEEIVLPSDRPVEIHCWAFQNCKSLKRIYIPANASFSGWTHVEYCGMDYVNKQFASASDILAGCSALETITFGSEEVKAKFLAAQGNNNTVNNYGVTLVVE